MLSDTYGRSGIIPGPHGALGLALAPREGGYIGNQAVPPVRNTRPSREVERSRDRLEQEKALLPEARRGAIVTLEEGERMLIRQALAATGGLLYGSDGAAVLLGVNPSTLRSRMKRLGIAKQCA